MRCRDRLLVVGINNSGICAQITNIYDKNQFINEDILAIAGDSDSLVHSILIEDNILYIIDSQHNVLYKYNVNQELLKECYTGRDPRHLCDDANNIYVTNFETDNIAIIDKYNMELQATIPAGIKPHDVKISKDFENIYVSCYDENRIMQYNLPTGEKVFYNTEGMPMHILVVNNKIFVLTYYTNGVTKTKINVIDLDKANIEKICTIEGLSTIFDYDEQLKKLYILNIEYECLYVIDIDEMEIIKKIYLGGYPEDISIGNNNIFIVNSTKQLLTVIDRLSLEIKANIELDFVPQCAAII